MLNKNVVGIIVKNKKILLQLRDNKKNIIFPNRWGFFGGEVNNNESHYKAIKREMFEELNIINIVMIKITDDRLKTKLKLKIISFFPNKHR